MKRILLLSFTALTVIYAEAQPITAGQHTRVETIYVADIATIKAKGLIMRLVWCIVNKNSEQAAVRSSC